MIPLCQSEGVGLLPWSPLARGLLAGTRKALVDDKATPRSGTDAHAKQLYDQPSDWDVVQAVQEVAQQRGLPPARIALAWLLSRPGVVAPIIGATKLSHLEDAVAALDVTLSAEEIQRLEAPYRPHPVKQ